MLHLPETAHLYVLLNCAQFDREYYLEPEIESYLIQTLLRYSELHDEEFAETMTAQAIVISNEAGQDDYLKEIADYCLICTGLMSDRFIYEEASYERLQEVGQSAFSMLSDRAESNRDIYLKLSKNFSFLVDILQCSQTLITDDEQMDCVATEIKFDVLTEKDIKKEVYFTGKKSLFSHTNILYH